MLPDCGHLPAFQDHGVSTQGSSVTTSAWEQGDWEHKLLSFPPLISDLTHPRGRHLELLTMRFCRGCDTDKPFGFTGIKAGIFTGECRVGGRGVFNPQHLPPVCAPAQQKELTPAHPMARMFRGFLGPPEAMALCKSGQTLSLLMAVKLCSLFTSITEIRVSPLIHWLIEDYLTCHGAKRQPRDLDLPADPGWFCITRLSAGLRIQPVTHNVLQTISSSLPASAEWPEVSLIRDLAYSYHNGSM